MNTEASWTARYGLYEVAYEGGWALGGDNGGTAIQNSAKFNNPNMSPEAPSTAPKEHKTR